MVQADATDAALDRWLIADALGELSRRPSRRARHASTSAAARWREAADELGVPSGTVKSRLHYALRALRLALQERGVTGR